MFKTNYHTHSSFCDGTGLPEEYVQSAIKKKFDVLGFSGHAPIPFENDWAINQTSLNEYLKDLKTLKETYGDRIDIYMGLEVDYIENKMAPSDKFYKDLKLDFIIGSVHMLPDRNTGEYLSVDYTKKEIEQLINDTYNGNAKKLVKEYYRLIRKMSDSKGFHILGHLDVIKKRNIDSLYFNETENWYKEEIEDTLLCIAKNKQIMEVNTGQILKDPSRIYPSPWILKKAGEYNIPIVLNSDAHRADRIDNYFEEAKDIIKMSGYTELTVLKNNKTFNDSLN
jgi:histidinol-phosphatase (PHP family)